MPKEMKTPAELAELAAQVGRCLNEGLSKEWQLLERPFALAQLFNALEPREGCTSLLLSNVVDAFVGIAAMNWTKSVLELHETLLARGFQEGMNAYEVGNDVYVAALPPVIAPKPSLGKWFDEQFGPETSMRTARVITLRTQNQNFLLLLNESYGRQRLHIRQFWDSLAQVQASGHYYSEKDLADRTDLTLADAIRLASQLADKYSDDVPGVHRVRRVSLPTILAGSLFAGDEGCSPALRYADFRDAGYILSAKSDSDGFAEADRMLSDSFVEAERVMAFVDSALCCLEEETDA